MPGPVDDPHQEALKEHRYVGQLEGFRFRITEEFVDFDQVDQAVAEAIEVVTTERKEQGANGLPVPLPETLEDADGPGYVFLLHGLA